MTTEFRNTKLVTYFFDVIAPGQISKLLFLMVVPIVNKELFHNSGKIWFKLEV